MTLPRRRIPCPDCHYTAEQQRQRRATLAPLACPHRPRCPIAGTMRFCDRPGCGNLSMVLHEDRALCARCYLAILDQAALAAIIREEPPSP